MFTPEFFVALIVGAVIISLLVALLLPWTSRIISWRIGKRTAPSSGTADTFTDVRQALTIILERLQTSLSPIADREDSATFDFQGGHFGVMFVTDDDSSLYNTVSISYFGCLTCPLADSVTLERLVNELNMSTIPPKAVISPSGNLTDEDESLSLSLHVSGIRLIPDDEGVRYFHSLLTSFFRLQRIAIERLEELRHQNPSETVRNRLPLERVQYMLAHAEIETQPEPWTGPWYEFPAWTVGEFVRKLFGHRVSEPLSVVLDGMSVSEESKLAEILDKNRTYQNLDVIETNKDGRVYHVIFRSENLDDRLWKLRVNVAVSGLPINAYRSIESEETLPEVRCFTLGIYLCGPELYKAEAEYMAEEQGLVERCKNADAAYSLYWGKILYADNRLLEAEHYLLNAWSALARNLSANSENTSFNEEFGELCFMLGRLYYEIGRYHDSYYYMDMIVQEHRLRWTQQYVVTLQALGDPRLRQMLNGLRASVDVGNREDLSAEQNMLIDEMFAFIDRQEIVLNIREGQTEKARTALMSLLNRNPDDEFALSWLKRIRH